MVVKIIHYDSNLKKMLTEIISNIDKINIEESHDKSLIYKNYQFISTFNLEIEDSFGLVDSYLDVVQYTVYDNGKQIAEIQADCSKNEGEINV